MPYIWSHQYFKDLVPPPVDDGTSRDAGGDGSGNWTEERWKMEQGTV
ncbi:MAG: hypothetical protein SV186_05455 [Candidatus Nanohaloarchaea archaeon]|nr:hypothetical protein [Candidatus Nanohaloarchaea archaeon]